MISPVYIKKTTKPIYVTGASLSGYYLFSFEQKIKLLNQHGVMIKKILDGT